MNNEEKSIKLARTAGYICGFAIWGLFGLILDSAARRNGFPEIANMIDFAVIASIIWPIVWFALKGLFKQITKSTKKLGCVLKDKQEEKREEKADPISGIPNTITPPTVESERTIPAMMLKRLHDLNDDIPDQDLSIQIDQIEEITREIVKRKESNPEQEKQLNAFLQKHLPPLMDTLEIYSRLDDQNIEEKNLQRAKASVAGMLSEAITGYRRKLNEMYSDDIVELTVNANVVKQMLQQDGLVGEQLTL